MPPQYTLKKNAPPPPSSKQQSFSKGGPSQNSNSGFQSQAASNHTGSSSGGVCGESQSEAPPQVAAMGGGLFSGGFPTLKSAGNKFRNSDQGHSNRPQDKEAPKIPPATYRPSDSKQTSLASTSSLNSYNQLPPSKPSPSFPTGTLPKPQFANKGSEPPRPINFSKAPKSNAPAANTGGSGPPPPPPARSSVDEQLEIYEEQKHEEAKNEAVFDSSSSTNRGRGVPPTIPSKPLPSTLSSKPPPIPPSKNTPAPVPASKNTSLFSANRNQLSNSGGVSNQNKPPPSQTMGRNFMTIPNKPTDRCNIGDSSINDFERNFDWPNIQLPPPDKFQNVHKSFFSKKMPTQSLNN